MCSQLGCSHVLLRVLSVRVRVNVPCLRVVRGRLLEECGKRCRVRRRLLVETEVGVKQLVLVGIGRKMRLIHYEVETQPFIILLRAERVVPLAV